MLDRRGFLKFVGGAVTGTVFTPVIWKGLDDISIWSQNWGWIPKIDYGNQKFTTVRTVSKLCPSAVGMNVRLLGDRPIRTVGDPRNPLSLGGISPLAVTEVQLRYSPARLKRPLRRSADGSYRELTWEAAERLLQEKFAKARKSNTHGEKIVCISGDENGTMNELLSGFTTQLGKGRFFVMPSDAQATAKAWTLMGGQGRVGFDFEHSDYVLAVGANVLESWGPVISNRRAWGHAHPSGAEATMKLDYAGPVQNNTATGADHWLPIKPGTELYLLLGIAAQLLSGGAITPNLDVNALKAAVEPWTKEVACTRTGLSPKQFDEVVNTLMSAKAPLVIAGSEMDQGGGANAIRLAIAINLILGRLNKEGGMRAIPTAAPVVRGAGTYENLMAEDLASYSVPGGDKSIDILMVYEANPLYALPGDKMKKLFEKAAFSVAFSSFFDETAQRCDLILPNAMGLERYDDVAQPFGYAKYLYTLARPVAEPLYEARPAGDVLIDVAKKAGIDLGVQNVIEMLQIKAKVVGADWNALMNGDTFVSDETTSGPSCQFSPEAVHILRNAATTKVPTGKLAVAFVSRLGLGTAESGIPPFNVKTIGENELIQNELTANINAATIKKFKLYENSRIELSTASGKVIARIHANEGVVNDTVALTLGFGHTKFDAFNNNKGMNALNLTAPVAEAGATGLAVWNDIQVNVVKAKA